jgi:hypothetical protein
VQLRRAKAGLRFGGGQRNLLTAARVVELADTPDLGSGSARIGGSSPLARTIFTQEFEVSSASNTVLTQETAEIEGRIQLALSYSWKRLSRQNKREKIVSNRTRNEKKAYEGHSMLSGETLKSYPSGFVFRRPARRFVFLQSRGIAES